MTVYEIVCKVRERTAVQEEAEDQVGALGSLVG